MSSNTFIQDHLTRHQVYTQRLGATIANEATEAIKEIADEAVDMIGSGNIVGDIRRVQANLENIITSSGFVGSVEDDLSDYASYETEYYAGLLGNATTADVTLVAPEMVYGVVSTESMLLQQGKRGWITTTIADMVSSLGDGVENKIISTIRAGIATGKTTDEIVKDVRRIANKALPRDVKSMVLTITNHIGAEARGMVTAANLDIIKGERYVATLDSRTTWLCSGLDGNFYQFGVGPHPPLHYRCRSLRVPVIKDEYNVSMNGYGKRPSVSLTKDGKRDISQVDSRTKFSGWLKDQPDWFIKDYLGDTRGSLFISGKLGLPDFVNDQGGIIKLSDLRDRDGVPVI